MIRRKQTQSFGSNSAFSLIELAAAIALTLGVATATLTIITQHTVFLRHLSLFTFIRDEAPQVNRILASLLSSANDYRIYSDRSIAFSNGNSGNAGSVLMLSYRNPSGINDRSAIVFETVNGRKQLNYYQYKNGWGSSPNWTITSMAAGVSFSDATGVLTITMLGENGEKITYVGTTK